MNNFTIDMAVKSENVTSNSILRLYKQNMMLKFKEVKSNEPRLTQKENSKQLGFSDSTVKRFRDDIQMDSPFKRDTVRKKNEKSNTTITETQTHKPIENTENRRNNKKNDFKGGSILENEPENNTNFLTLARKMVDNV